VVFVVIKVDLHLVRLRKQTGSKYNSDMNRPLLDRAEILMDFGREEMAEGDLRKHLAENPEDADAHALLALCFHQQNLNYYALNQAGIAIWKDPRNGFAHAVMGEILLRQGRPDEARNAALSAIEVESNNSSFYCLLARIALTPGIPKDGVAAAEAGLQVNADNAACRSVLSVGLAELGRYPEAIERGGEAVALDPESWYVHTNLGWVLLQAGQREKAIIHFTTALGLQPKSDHALRGLTVARRASNVFYRALLACRVAINRVPHLKPLLLTAALVAAAIAMPPRHALTLDTNSITLWLAIAIVLFQAWVDDCRRVKPRGFVKQEAPSPTKRQAQTVKLFKSFSLIGLLLCFLGSGTTDESITSFGGLIMSLGGAMSAEDAINNPRRWGCSTKGESDQGRSA
jgi:tetratricopeptide (TPR) repeat protein